MIYIKKTSPLIGLYVYRVDGSDIHMYVTYVAAHVLLPVWFF